VGFADSFDSPCRVVRVHFYRTDDQVGLSDAVFDALFAPCAFPVVATEAASHGLNELTVMTLKAAYSTHHGNGLAGKEGSLRARAVLRCVGWD